VGDAEVESYEVESVTDDVLVDALVGRFPVAELAIPILGHDVGLTRRRLRATCVQPLGN
jgi:hypothetical protein